MPSIHVNGTHLHYFDQGTGTPILFIHPPMIGAVCFAFQVQDLRQSYRVIGFDIRGQGQSAPSTQPITYNLIVSDAVGLLDALEVPSAIVCGYSTGATVALEAMLQYPDRFPAGIVVSGMSEVSDPWVKTEIQLAIRAVKMQSLGLLSYVLAKSNAKAGPLQDAMLRTGKRSDVANTEQYFMESLTHNCTDVLEHITQPVLLVYGMNDRRFRPYGEILGQRLPNPHQVMVPGVSHTVPGRAPAALAQAIREFGELPEVRAGMKQMRQTEQVEEKRVHAVEPIAPSTREPSETHPVS